MSNISLAHLILMLRYIPIWEWHCPLRLYREAFNALKKAQSLGLNNPSIEKELLWLRNNQGLY
jgi:hypothetical protein